MKRRFLAWSRIAAFVMVASFSGTTFACCDDFWSCAGAFFTAGASCAFEAAQNAINDFVHRVEQTRTQGEQQMQATTRDLDQEAANGCKAEDDRVTDGFSKVTTSRTAAMAAISSKGGSLPANVKTTLQRGQAKLDQLQNEAKTTKDESAAKLSQAASLRQAKIRDLNTAFQATFVAPLTGLVAPLIAALDPISAVATIAVLADQLSRIQGDTERAIAQGVDAFDAAVNGLIQELKTKSDAQQQRAQDAQALASAVQALTQAPTETNRQRVESLLGNNTRLAIAKTKFVKLNFTAINVAKTKTVPTIKNALSANAAFAKTVKVSPTVNFDKTGAEQRTKSVFDQRLAGKTGDALEAERKKLLAEANERFKKDPKTLAAVQKAINNEVDKRKPAAVKVKPIAGPGPIKK